MRFSYNTKESLKSLARLIIFVFVFFLYNKYPFYHYIKYYWAFWVWLAGLMVFVFIFGEIMRGMNNRMRGSEAEEDVEEELENLPDDFEILQNLVTGNHGNIDKVVVGPTGIWVVEVKSHAGYITFDGNKLVRDGGILEKDFLKQAWAEKCAVADLLENILQHKFNVQPVVCFSDPDARLKFGLKKIKGVYVIGYNWLNRLVYNVVAEHLSHDEIDKIKNVLSVYSEN